MGGGDFCISLHRTGLKCSETYIKIVSVFGFCCRIFLHPKYFKIFLDFFSRSSGAFALFFEIFGCLTTFKVNRPANALLYIFFLGPTFFFQVQLFFSRSNVFFLGPTFFFSRSNVLLLGSRIVSQLLVYFTRIAILSQKAVVLMRLTRIYYILVRKNNAIYLSRHVSEKPGNMIFREEIR